VREFVDPLEIGEIALTSPKVSLNMREIYALNAIFIPSNMVFSLF